jgi:hypothetical protein
MLLSMMAVWRLQVQEQKASLARYPHQTFTSCRRKRASRGAEWEYILTLDETIPANRVARVQARKRLEETKPK